MSDTIILALIAVIGIVVLIWFYNQIVSGRNAIQRAWSDVIVQERQKLKVIPELERIVKEHKAYESGVLEKLTEMRAAVTQLASDTVDTDALKTAESKTKSALSGLKVAMEAYPDLKTASLMNNLMREIADQQDNIAAAIRIFNQNVELFNNSIETFPGSAVNRRINKEKRQRSFDDNEAASGLSFRPGAE
jgi:LemA protein